MWEQLDSGRVTHRFEPVVLAATLAVIPVFVIEADGSSRAQDIAYGLNWLIWLVFAAELAFTEPPETPPLTAKAVLFIVVALVLVGLGDVRTHRHRELARA